ncbi:MAG: hypothetical protein H6827_09690 [Planctomycetes bacterium]|nr:hypothetical protein [Planctomycetota bacterium]
MAELAMYQGQEITFATCEEMRVLPSVLQQCQPIPGFENPHARDVLLSGRFEIPAGVKVAKVTGETILALLAECRHGAGCNGKPSSYKVAGFGIRHDRRALIVTCPDCGKLWAITPEIPEAFNDVLDSLGGDMLQLSNEWRVLEYMLGLSTRLPAVDPELLLAEHA